MYCTSVCLYACTMCTASSWGCIAAGHFMRTSAPRPTTAGRLKRSGELLGCQSCLTRPRLQKTHLCSEKFSGFSGSQSGRPACSVLPVPGYGRHHCWFPSSEPPVRSF